MREQKRTTICFYREDYWVLDFAKTRAAIKGISTTEEMVQMLKNSYLPEVQKEKFRTSFIKKLDMITEKEMKRLKEELKTSPDCVDFFELGIAYGKAGVHEEAAKIFNKLVAIFPEDPEAHYCLGVAYRNLGEFQNAVYALEEAIQLRKDYVEAYVNLALAFGRWGRFRDAVDALKKALELKPNDADIHFALGVALYISGDRVSALKECLTLQSSDRKLSDELYNLMSIKN